MEAERDSKHLGSRPFSVTELSPLRECEEGWEPGREAEAPERGSGRGSVRTGQVDYWGQSRGKETGGQAPGGSEPFPAGGGKDSVPYSRSPQRPSVKGTEQPRPRKGWAWSTSDSSEVFYSVCSDGLPRPLVVRKLHPSDLHSEGTNLQILSKSVTSSGLLSQPVKVGQQRLLPPFERLEN